MITKKSFPEQLFVIPEEDGKEFLFVPYEDLTELWASIEDLRNDDESFSDLYNRNLELVGIYELKEIKKIKVNIEIH